MGLPFLAASNDFAKEINFTSTSTITNGNTQIVPLSTGLGLNVPTSGDFRLSVNGTSYLQVNSSDCLVFPTASTPSAYTNFKIWNFTDTELVLNTPGSGKVSINCGTSSYLKVSSAGVVFPTNQSASSSDLTLARFSSTVLFVNVPTSGKFGINVNGSEVSSFTSSLFTVANTDGIVLTSTTGGVTAASRQFFSNSSGIGYNTPSATHHYFGVNGIFYARLGGNGLEFGNSPPTVAVSGYPGVSVDASGNLALCSPTGKGTGWVVNGNTEGFLGTFGIILGWTSSPGITNAAYKQIAPSSTGVDYNTPSSSSHIFKVNNTTIATISASGLVVVADPQDYDMFASRKYR